MNKLEIKYRKVEDLIPYARNSRIHSDAQVAQIAASIREFGFRTAVLVDGDNGIIAGHGRVLAARKLGMDEVPTVDGSDLTDNQRRAYVIADNKIALNAEWDKEMLLLEVADLEDAGVDIGILAFDSSELESKDVDYSVLDGEDVNTQITQLNDGTRKAIQIEFELEHFDEAAALVKFWREQGAYVGYMLLEHLREEKNNL
jgi:ParB-like chromosome segregation protein Spo0J